MTFVVEGESCVDAVHALGLHAVTYMGGSSGVAYETLIADPGRTYVLCPDCDPKGMSHMRKVAEHLRPLGCVVQWFYTPGGCWDNPQGGYDIADWIERC